MGIMQKLGLVEAIEEEPKYTAEVQEQYEEEVSVSMNTENVDAANLIDEVYSQNDLSDKSKSIFKVEELINTMPKEMVTETKRTSVTAILGSFGIGTEDVVSDGKKRSKIIQSIVKKLATDAETELNAKSDEIEEHKKQIAILEQEISDKTASTKAMIASLQEEKERIGKLVDFIEGGKA